MQPVVLPTCTLCINHGLSPSRQRGLRDWIMGLLGREPMRCHNCGTRYYIKISSR